MDKDPEARVDKAHRATAGQDLPFTTTKLTRNLLFGEECA